MNSFYLKVTFQIVIILISLQDKISVAKVICIDENFLSNVRKEGKKGWQGLKFGEKS